MARARAAGAALLLACAAAAAQTVSLQGMLGRQALLVIDGAAPKGVAPGTTWRGVTVVSTSSDQAVIEVAGRRQTLRVGETPGNVGGKGPAGSGGRIVLTAGSGGHFVTRGTINGHTASLMVDTGATYVSLGAPDARRLGLDYKRGEAGIMQATVCGPDLVWADVYATALVAAGGPPAGWSLPPGYECLLLGDLGEVLGSAGIDRWIVPASGDIS